MNYAVIEYTPGYLPEDDDPPQFDQFTEALNYLNEKRSELFEAEWAYEYEDGPTFALEVEEIVVSGKGDTGVVHAGFSYTDRRKTHDLGRIVEIVALNYKAAKRMPNA